MGKRPWRVFWPSVTPTHHLTSLHPRGTATDHVVHTARSSDVHTTNNYNTHRTAGRPPGLTASQAAVVTGRAGADIDGDHAGSARGRADGPRESLSTSMEAPASVETTR